MADTRLELQVAANAQAAIQSLDSLLSAMNRVKDAVGKGFKFGNAEKSIGRIASAFSSALKEDVVQRYERMGVALQQISANNKVRIQISGNIGEATKQIQNLQNTLQATNSGTTVFGSATDAVSDAANQMREVGEAASGASAGLESAKTQFEGTTDAASGAAGQIKAAGNAAKNSESSTKSLAERLKDLGKVMASTKGHSNNLLSSFIRIAKYRFLRAILREITEGVTTGVKNMYEYAKAVGLSFAPAVDSAKDALLRMKNSIGAALAPLIEMLIPYLMQAVQWFINLINVVNQFLALLNGQTEWTRAITATSDAMDDVKTSAGGAAKAIKEAKGLLADWDELNIIQQQPGDTGSGGGGGKTKKAETDYTKMFEQVSVFDEKVKKVFGWFQDHLQEILSIAKLVGAALLGWKLSTAFTGVIGTVLKVALGLGVAFYGVKMQYEALSDQFEHKIDWNNFTRYIEGAALAVGGLTLAFGTKGLGSGLLFSGVLGLASAINDISKGAEASKEALTQLKLSALMAGAGASFLTGSWIPVLASALGVAVVEIYERKEQIFQYVSEHVNEIAGILQDAGYATAAFGALLALSGISIVGGLTMVATGLGIALLGNKLPDLVTNDVKTTLKNVADVVGTYVGAVGALLVISGLNIPLGIGMMVAGLALETYSLGEGEDLLQVMKSGWDKIAKYVTLASLGFLPVGMALALTGHVAPGVALIGMAVSALAVRKATGGDLLADIKGAWEEIDSWVTPLVSAGSVVLGAILAFTGVATATGIAMIAAGVTGLTLSAATGDLLDTIKQKWEEIAGYATVATLGLVPLGLALALMGHPVIGIALLAMSASVLAVRASEGVNLLEEIKLKWAAIESWALPLAAGSFVLGAILAFTGVGIMPGIAMMAAGVAGMWASAETHNLRDEIRAKWLEVKRFIAPLSAGSFVLGMILALTGVGIVPGVIMMLAGITGLASEGENGGLVDWLTQVWADVTGLWTNTVSPWLEEKVKWIEDNVITPVRNFFEGLAQGVIEVFESIVGVDYSKKTKEELMELYNQKVPEVITSTGRVGFAVEVERNMDSFKGTAEQVKEAMQKVFSEISGVPVEVLQLLDITGWDSLSEDLQKRFYSILKDRVGGDIEMKLSEIGVQFPVEPIIEEAAADDVPTQLDDILDDTASGYEVEVDTSALETPVVLPAAETSVFTSSVESAVTSVSASMEATAKSTASSVMGQINAVHQALLATINDWYFLTGGVTSSHNTARRDFHFASGSRYHYAYASGGFPETGDYFLARESGPELVGTMGNRTAVANNDQIVAGIASGVAAAQQEQNTLLRQQNEYLRRLLAKESTVKVEPSSKWGRFQRQSEAMYARNTGTGG